MIDVLSYKINEPLYLHYYEKSLGSNKNFEIKRMLQKSDFIDAFEESRNLLMDNQILLKAYGWYRKGLISDDPYDQFLAFWNVIEILVPRYHNETKRSKKGIINKI